MDFKELRDKSAVELQHELLEKRKHLFTLRTQAVTEKLEDPTQIGKTRRDIARILTALRQQEIEQSKNKAPAVAAATAVAAANPA